jgi:chromosome segregation ATPase
MYTSSRKIGHNRFQEVNKELTDKLQEYQKKYELQSQNLEVLQTELDNEKEMTFSKNKEIDHLTIQLNNKVDFIYFLNSEINVLRNKLQTVTTQLESEVTSQKLLIQESHKKIELLQDENNLLQSVTENFKSNISSLIHLTNTQTQSIQNLNNELRVLKNKESIIESELEHSKNLIRDYKSVFSSPPPFENKFTQTETEM